MGLTCWPTKTRWASVKLYEPDSGSGPKTRNLSIKPRRCGSVNPAAPLDRSFRRAAAGGGVDACRLPQPFFTEFFHFDPDSPPAGERQIKLTCRYGYSVAGDTPLLQDDLVASLPLLHSPEQAFNLARDWGSKSAGKLREPFGECPGILVREAPAGYCRGPLSDRFKCFCGAEPVQPAGAAPAGCSDRFK